MSAAVIRRLRSPSCTNNDPEPLPVSLRVDPRCQLLQSLSESPTPSNPFSGPPWLPVLCSSPQVIVLLPLPLPPRCRAKRPSSSSLCRCSVLTESGWRRKDRGGIEGERRKNRTESQGFALNSGEKRKNRWQGRRRWGGSVGCGGGLWAAIAGGGVRDAGGCGRRAGGGRGVGGEAAAPAEVEADEAPMEEKEKRALYAAVESFVGKGWNGSGMFPDPCGQTPILNFILL